MLVALVNTDCEGIKCVLVGGVTYNIYIDEKPNNYQLAVWVEDKLIYFQLVSHSKNIVDAAMK